MIDVFIKMSLGHFVGDYLLQNKAMAFAKSQKGWRGLAACLGHCAIYTAAVCLFAWKLNPLFATLVFLSHFLIDRWSLGYQWLRLIGGRTFETVYDPSNQYGETDLIFTCIVYTLVDNTMHLVLLWLIGQV